MTAKSSPLWPMPGGIQPPANKQQSLQEGIRSAALPQRLVIALSQPGFARPELCVAEGERVLKGQVLARGAALMGLTCHASTSGLIIAITEHLVPNDSGLPELCAILQPDGEERWQKLPELPDHQTLDAQILMERIAEAGICGLGGAGLPAQAKLQGALGKIHTLIINACECEPFITADDALMRERAAEIIDGIRILLRICAAPQCLIGIEDNKPEAIAALRAAIDDAHITLVVVPAKYPSGAEKQLIYQLTGTEIPSGSLSIDSGILCHNVGTAQAINRAVVHGEALVSRVTTVTGAALRRPGNLDVLIGTSIADLLRECEVDESRLQRLLNGGPLMGVQLAHADVPVLKTTNCVLATTLDELPLPAPQQACIRCGFCSDVCPVNLLPQQLYSFARSRELEKATQHNLFDCIECGACAYVCPSSIPLVQYYRSAKAEIREAHDKHRRAEYSRQRYEFHQARKAVEQAQEERRRAERAALIKAPQEPSSTGSSNAQAAVAAALARVKAKKAASQLEAESAAAATAPTGNAAGTSMSDKGTPGNSASVDSASVDSASVDSVSVDSASVRSTSDKSASIGSVSANSVQGKPAPDKAISDNAVPDNSPSGDASDKDPAA